MLDRIDEVALFPGLVAVYCAILEIAFRLGRRQSARSDEAVNSHVGALQAALLGLLALLLGFNFAMAGARFDARKSLIQEEVSAITTTWLRGLLLQSPQRQEITKLLQDYVGARIEFNRAGTDDELIEKAQAAAVRIEARLWTLAGVVEAQNAHAVPTGLFIQSLNDLINVNQKRRAALDNHVPEIVVYLLLAVSAGSLGFIAYGLGLRSRERHGASVIFALLIATVFTIIVDLDQPRSGLIRVSEDGMERLQEALQQYTP